MNSFEYAHPETEAEALGFLNDYPAETALLAGGTDLIGLLREDVLSPRRVVDLKNIPTYSGITRSPLAASGGYDDGIMIGALATLDDLQESPLLKNHRSLLDVVDGIRAIQIQSSGTIGGDLCLLPNCWYFRSGYGLLAMQNGVSLPEVGDNRYHAILGNQGPAKFVSATRFAPGLMAWGAKVRIAGPKPNREQWLPLEDLYRVPKTERQGLTVLKPGQLLTHLWLPEAGAFDSATYEVLPSEGLDWPLAAAAVTLRTELGVVRDARITLGHVAPKPWKADRAAKALIGRSINEDVAASIGEIAVADATPLSMNEYKVQLARTAVKRAILRAAGRQEGGL